MWDMYCISATIHKWEMWPERPINKWPTRVWQKKSNVRVPAKNKRMTPSHQSIISLFLLSHVSLLFCYNHHHHHQKQTQDQQTISIHSSCLFFLMAVSGNQSKCDKDQDFPSLWEIFSRKRIFWYWDFYFTKSWLWAPQKKS